MDYYKQGGPANADKIKAAFEKLGIDVLDFGFADKAAVYFSIGGCVQCVPYSINIMNILHSHPDYKELELPKPHYDISNFKPFDKVLVRDGDMEYWNTDLFSSYHDEFHCFRGSWEQCIPFDGNKHLLGTTDMPSEEYINW